MKPLTFIILLLISTRLLFGQEESLPLLLEKSDSTNYLVFHITGDGGMRGFDVKLSDEFKAHKLSYIFLNAYKYFWSPKSPDQLASDIVPVIRDYLEEWGKNAIVLSGFSFGAEVIPFLYTRLPEGLKQKVKLVVLLSPASTSDFTIHIADMIGADNTYVNDVVKEVEKITKPQVLAIFGEKEDSSFPSNHKQDNYHTLFIKGSHHFTDADGVMESVLDELKK
jgi:type IV secretory pathway VirJ component